jgi:hypothetical protein
VQSTEEELRAGTREREAGEVGVRKTVRTDRESVEVPTRHEEVTVDRIPVEGEASEAEIDDEVGVPVTEEDRPALQADDRHYRDGRPRPQADQRLRRGLRRRVVIGAIPRTTAATSTGALRPPEPLP